MKNILCCLCALISVTSLSAQKFVLGINAGAGYNNSPVIKQRFEDLEITPLTNRKISPAIFFKWGYNVRKWQIRLSAGYQNLGAKYKEVISGYSGYDTIYSDRNFPCFELNVALNRTFHLKGMEVYAGLSGGYLKMGQFYREFTPASNHGSGVSLGLQTGIVRPVSKHFAINAELSGKLLAFRTSLPFNCRLLATTVGISYRI